MKKLYILIGIIILLIGGYYFMKSLGESISSSGSSEEYAPDTVVVGNPAIITFITTATGGGSIKGRYTDISLHYRLAGESNYKTILPQPIPLPDNFKSVQSNILQSEAYKFIIPPYPKGTIGEIEYNVDLVFDGYANHHEGIKKIKLIDE